MVHGSNQAGAGIQPTSKQEIRVYVNHLRANSRQGGWNLQNHNEVLQNIAGECLHYTHKI